LHPSVHKKTKGSKRLLRGCHDLRFANGVSGADRSCDSPRINYLLQLRTGQVGTLGGIYLDFLALVDEGWNLDD
jgi:hypothetical protein